MVATQPKFDVIFKELAVTAIQRMQRGTVIMILNDDTNALIDKAVYTGLGDVNKADFTTANYDLLTLCFMGNPYKVVVIKADDEVIKSIVKPHMLPAEMETIKLDKKVLKPCKVLSFEIKED